jgi:hypothetical protein
MSIITGTTLPQISTGDDLRLDGLYSQTYDNLTVENLTVTGTLTVKTLIVETIYITKWLDSTGKSTCSNNLYVNGNLYMNNAAALTPP